MARDLRTGDLELDRRLTVADIRIAKRGERQVILHGGAEPMVVEYKATRILRVQREECQHQNYFTVSARGDRHKCKKCHATFRAKRPAVAVGG